jgi:FMN-dependent NADH-azoreductase
MANLADTMSRLLTNWRNLHREPGLYKGVLMILLNIQTSPRGSKSISTAATDAFVEAYRTAHPDVTIDNLNVWEEGLPEFDSEAIGAKYKGVSKEAMSDAESAIWKSIQSLAARFQAADLIVLGVPMWNFAYPYKLKQLIDLVCQRNFLFTFSEGKFGPLLKTRNAVVIYSRGQTDLCRTFTDTRFVVRPPKRLHRLLASLRRCKEDPQHCY